MLVPTPYQFVSPVFELVRNKTNIPVFDSNDELNFPHFGKSASLEGGKPGGTCLQAILKGKH